MKRKPRLHPKMSVADFRGSYWLKEELIELARQMRLSTHGYKPELGARIERRLSGLPDRPDTKPSHSGGARDSDKRITRQAPVVNFRSDAKTREFFKAQIGPHFHFTYHVNQYRLNNKGLTYGDLIDEWQAEK
ncbi:MAG: SAP domain-containing protein [Gammaproteobacteria bacterium]|nr:SAP domain-containing protein [Gammaproteobacteria bacterium]